MHSRPIALELNFNRPTVKLNFDTVGHKKTRTRDVLAIKFWPKCSLLLAEKLYVREWASQLTTFLWWFITFFIEIFFPLSEGARANIPFI